MARKVVKVVRKVMWASTLHHEAGRGEPVPLHAPLTPRAAISRAVEATPR